MEPFCSGTETNHDDVIMTSFWALFRANPGKPHSQIDLGDKIGSRRSTGLLQIALNCPTGTVDEFANSDVIAHFLNRNLGRATIFLGQREVGLLAQLMKERLDFYFRDLWISYLGF